MSNRSAEIIKLSKDPHVVVRVMRGLQGIDERLVGQGLGYWAGSWEDNHPVVLNSAVETVMHTDRYCKNMAPRPFISLCELQGHHFTWCRPEKINR